MLKVKNLVKIYKIGKTKETVKALNNVSIDFPDKGLVFLLGKSGSGKSTLLNAIGGLDSFDSGEIIIKGKSSKDFSQSDFDSYRNTFIGFIFQEYNVLEEFTVAKNLSIALELQGKKADKEAVNNLLSQVEMLDFAKRKPNQLSGGQKQRVAIARALIKNPEIIMADEPTGALDSNTGKQVMETLKKLSETKLVIIVSHDREFAEIYGDRIIELKDGKILQDVTKKEVESQKTDSGVSIIDDKIIHIKKGITLTNDDINKINTVLKTKTASSDIIISIDESANAQVKKANFITEEGNKESFLQTQPEDVAQKQYDPKNFKLIKSQLKFKDSFKMGASALKNKVAKLVFTIFLSFLAFGMFGIIDTLSSFNRAAAIFHTVEQFNSKTISILKEQEGDYSNDVMPFKEEDIRILSEKYPDIKLKKIVGAEINFGSSYYGNYYSKTLRITDLSNSTSNQACVPYYSGMTYIAHNADANATDELSKYGLTLVAGRLPNADNNKEICISKHLVDCFKKINSSLENKSTEELYNEFLTTYKNCSDEYGRYSFTIVGIIDDGSDWTEYMNKEASELNADYMLQQKLSRELDFGFSNMLYINEDFYNELLSKPVNMYSYIFYDGVSLGYNFESQYTNSIEGLYNMKQEERINSYLSSKNFYYKNGDVWSNGQFIDLNNNEIILESYYFDTMFNTTNDEQRKTKLNGSTPLTVKVQGTTDSSTYQTVKTYTVVGYHQSSEDFFANSTTINELTTALDGYFEQRLTVNEETNLPLYLNEIKTFQQSFGEDSWFDLTKEDFANEYISYYKNNGSIISNGNFIELQDNEILLRDYYFQNIASGEELKALIDSGLTIQVYSDWKGEHKLMEFTVVGLTSDYHSYSLVSQNTIDTTMRDIFGGFDYSIAVLSSDSKTNEDFIKYCESFNKQKVKYTVQTGATPILDQFGDIFNTLTEVFLYVGIGFAVFAALLLMNFISTSISYKKREIGILRALGARGSDVFGIFFNESFIIAMINFVLAMTATIVTCGILNNLIITKLGLDLVLLSVGIRQILLIFGISLLTAFLSSLLPVMKIARKKPIDAINNR